MTATHGAALCSALGASPAWPIFGSGPIHAPASARLIFEQMSAIGWLQQRTDGAFDLTPRGAEAVQRFLVEQIIDTMVADLASEAASITAAELVGPNALEYDRVCERFIEDPAIIQRAQQELLRSCVGALLNLYRLMPSHGAAPGDACSFRDAMVAQWRSIGLRTRGVQEDKSSLQPVSDRP